MMIGCAASISNSSKNRTQHAANPSAESLPQSPRHRKRHSTDWSPAVNRQETPADCLTTGGSVAAAVEDLESRCRSSSWYLKLHEKSRVDSGLCSDFSS